MSYHVSHRVSDCVVSFRSPMTTLARDQRRAAIISRDGSSKNRNLVYLSAHRTASSRIISPSLVSPPVYVALRCWVYHIGPYDVTRVYVHMCTQCTLNQMGMYTRACRKKEKERGGRGRERERERERGNGTWCRRYDAAQSNYRPYRVIDELCAIGTRLLCTPHRLAASLQGPRLCESLRSFTLPIYRNL